MNDAAKTSVGMRIEIARTIEEVETFRDFYEKTQWYPEADIDYFLTILKANPDSARPHVMVLSIDGRPSAMIVGRIDETTLTWKIGYKMVGKSPVRLLEIIYGGTLGDLCYRNSVALCRELGSSLARGEADVALLNHVRMDSDLYRAAVTAPSVLCRDRFTYPNPHLILSLPGTFEKFLKQQSKHARESVRYYDKRLKKEFPGGVVIKCYRAPADVDHAMQDIEAIAQHAYQRTLGKGFQHTPETGARWVLAASRQWLRVFVLYLNGEPSAFATGYAYQGTFHGADMAHNPEFRHYRVGTFLLMRQIEALCNEGCIHTFDLGLGDADYKRRLCTKSWQDATVYLFAPTLKGARLNAMRGFTTGMYRLSQWLVQRLGIRRWVKTRWRRMLVPKNNLKGQGKPWR